MDRETHATLKKFAGDYMRIDKELVATQNRIEKFEQMGWPTELDELSESYIERLDKFKDSKGRKLENIITSDDSIFAGWIDNTRGLGGKSVGLITGLIPYHANMKSVSATWKYLGLIVNDGVAPTPSDNVSLGFDPDLKAKAIHRVGKFAGVMSKGPYRDVYDDRREQTMESHPPMFDEDGNRTDPDCDGCDKAMGKTEQSREEHDYDRERETVAYDCGNVTKNREGAHWSDGHRHADAMRVVTKDIFRDWYRVANNQEAKY